MEKLISGKDQTKFVVSIEPQDKTLKIFTESPSGEISSHEVSNRYWILAHKPVFKHSIRLQGELWYRWGMQFTNREDFIKARQYYRKYDTYSIYDPKEAAMVNTGLTYFKGLKVQDVSILSFDIETNGLKHLPDSRVLLISNTYRKNGVITRKLFAYSDYKNDGEMIRAWCNWVREMNPSVLCGHNVVLFDLPYISHVAKLHDYQLELGRDNSVVKYAEYESQLRKDGSQSYTYKKIHIYGREIVDTFFLALKYDIGRKYENYKLKQIIKQEKLEVQGRVFYEAEKIRDNYLIPEEWEKIKQYAIHDSDDALALYDLMIPSFFYLCQSFPKSFQSIIESASGSQINAFMVRSYLQDKHSIPKASDAVQFEGAISLGNPGRYEHCFKVDVASLYPSIILTHDLYDQQKDPKQHFLQAARYFTAERLQNKKLGKETGDRYYKDLEQSQKIVCNSFYGFLGASGLNFNFPEGASFITKKGREILTQAISWAEEKKFTISNCDTDSIMITNGYEITTQEQENLLKDLNSLFPDTISWEHDGIFPRVLVIKAKNYILQKPGGALKIKGSALRASMKESRLQDFIKEVINLLLENNVQGVVDLYNLYVQEILNLKDISGWCSKRTVTKSVLNPERTNEQKVLDALEDEEGVQEGDKIWVYFDKEQKLKLKGNWVNDHDPYKLIEKLWKTVVVFETVVDKKLFIKYHLKTKRKLLE